MTDPSTPQTRPEGTDGPQSAPQASGGPEPGRGGADAADGRTAALDAAPHTGLVVQPYRDHGRPRWVFRCWGTDTCDGLLSLDHDTRGSAESARDRHVTEEHGEGESPFGETLRRAGVTREEFDRAKARNRGEIAARRQAKILHFEAELARVRALHADTERRLRDALADEVRKREAAETTARTLSGLYESAENAVTRVHEYVQDLDQMAESTTSPHDRRLYRALANDLRKRLGGQREEG